MTQDRILVTENKRKKEPPQLELVNEQLQEFILLPLPANSVWAAAGTEEEAGDDPTITREAPWQADKDFQTIWTIEEIRRIP